jgi:hypothetical protein
MSDKSDTNENNPKTADERLLKKYALWVSLVHEVTITSPPGMKLIIVTRCISTAGLLGMVPLHPTWCVYLITAMTFLAAEWRLGQLAASEFRTNKNTTQPGGPEKPGPAG